MDVALEELGEAIKLDPTNAQIYNVYGLVYAMLGEDAKARAELPAGARARAERLRDPPELGLVPVHARPRARSRSPSSSWRVRNPLYKTPEIALINAGKCCEAIGDRKRAEEYLQARARDQPGNPRRRVQPGAARRTGKRALDEARALMKRVMAQTSPPPEALYLGMCIERKLGDRPSEASYVSQLRNRYPESAEAKAIPPGTCE